MVEKSLKEWIYQVTSSIGGEEIERATPTITGGNSGNWSELIKIGHIVQLKLAVNFNLNLTAGTATVVGTVPDGFRPITEVTIGGYILGGTYGFLYVEPNGEIKLQRVSTGTGNLIRQSPVYITP